MCNSCGPRQRFLTIILCFWVLCDSPLRSIEWVTEFLLKAKCLTEMGISEQVHRLSGTMWAAEVPVEQLSACGGASSFRRPQCKTFHPSVCGEYRIYIASGHGAGLQINLGKEVWKFWLAACEEEWGSVSNSSWACSEYSKGDPLIILVTHTWIVLSDLFLVWDADLFLTEKIKSGLSTGKRWENADFGTSGWAPQKVLTILCW